MKRNWQSFDLKLWLLEKGKKTRDLEIIASHPLEDTIEVVKET